MSWPSLLYKLMLSIVCLHSICFQQSMTIPYSIVLLTAPVNTLSISVTVTERGEKVNKRQTSRTCPYRQLLVCSRLFKIHINHNRVEKEENNMFSMSAKFFDIWQSDLRKITTWCKLHCSIPFITTRYGYQLITKLNVFFCSCSLIISSFQIYIYTSCVKCLIILIKKQ